MNQSTCPTRLGRKAFRITPAVLKFSDPSPWLAAGAFEQTNVRSRSPSKPQTSSTRTVRSRARRPLASARLPAHDRCKSQPSGTVAQESGAPLIKPSTATINTRAIAAKKSSAESAPTAKARPLTHPAGALFLLLPLVLFGDACSVFYLFNGREQMLKSRWRGGGRRGLTSAREEVRAPAGTGSRSLTPEARRHHQITPRRPGRAAPGASG